MHREIYQSPYRTYRTEKISTEREQKIQIMIEETDLLITVTKRIPEREVIAFCSEEIQELRNMLKFWIKIHPEIQHSLDPIVCPGNAPKFIQTMCAAAKFAGVGPFAGVAGTIAQIVAAKLHCRLKEENLESDVIVENGGDIYCFSQKERIVGLIADPHRQCTVGLKIPAEDFPLAVCSSSATIGHSLSFGHGDLAVILAKNGSLADCLATRYGNLLKSEKDISKVLEQAQKDSRIKISEDVLSDTPSQSGLSGVFLQINDSIGAWGKIELTAIQ